MAKRNELATIETAIVATANAWLEQAEELEKTYFRDDRQAWDDEVAFGRYAALIDCRTELLKLLEK